MSETLTLPKNSRLVGLILIALAAWIMVTSAYRGTEQSQVRGGDFAFFYTAAQRLNAHQPLYVYEEKGQTYCYPPLFAIMLRPFVGTADITPDNSGKRSVEAEAQFWHAQKIWHVASTSCLLLAVLLFALAARMNLLNAAAIGVMIITGYHFWPTVMTFGLGQTNLIVVAALAGMIYADSRNKPMLAAVFIVAAALVKTWFVGMIIYFIIRRAWKAGAACIIMGIVATALLFTIVGWSEFSTFWRLTQNYAAGAGTQVLSQSFAGFAALHFARNDHIDPLIDSRTLAAAVKWAGMLLVLGALAWAFFLPMARTAFDRRLRLSMISLSVLLLLPYSQNEYLVMALPGIWTLLLAPEESGILAFIVAAACYVLFTRPGPYYPNNALAYQHGLRSLMVSIPFFTLLLLWGTTVLTMLRRQKIAALNEISPDHLVETSAEPAGAVNA